MTRRGTTLAELLVVCAVFGLLMMIVVGLETSMNRLTRHEDAKDEANRNVLVAMEHLNDLLGRSRLSAPPAGTPSAATSATLEVPVSGSVSPSGPTLETHQILVDPQGDLRQVDPAGRRRRLASLGANGGVEFTWLPSGLLKVRVFYSVEPGKVVSEAEQELLLPNQS